MDAIFLSGSGGLTPMMETPYDNEALLQEALADYPDLIAGIATRGAAGRLLLVRREMPVADASGANVMSLDHLFVDQDGTPVLVEVKRSSDTRSRREVVAQMLDYAANGPAYWPVDRLRAFVEARLSEEQRDDYLLDQLQIEEEPEEFWRRVENNLRQGRLRLVFLADRLAPELVRIIEFLNEQMRDTEVLGIELPQYRGAGSENVIYVPRVIGRTATAVDVKRVPPLPAGEGEDAFVGQLRERTNPEQVEAALDLMSAWTSAGGSFRWGKGARETSCTFGWDGTNANAPIVIYPRGSIEVNFQHIKAYTPFNSAAQRELLRARLRAMAVTTEEVLNWPRPVLGLPAFVDASKRAALVETLNWFSSVVSRAGAGERAPEAP